ncbi:MAG: pantetheine-phosphate adenylyltransferase [Phycisphaerae bacterium]
MPGKLEPIIAIYAGSFDPVTHGHLDIIRRSADLFNKLIIGVGRNPQKEPLFSAEERIALIEPHMPEGAPIEVESYEGLTIDFARQCGARVLIRGIRNQADLSDELQQANLNRVIGHIETVFLLASDTHMVTSSTYIRQIFELGGGDREQIERLVPANVAEALARKLRKVI